MKKFFQKMGNMLSQNIGLAVVFAICLVLFLYFTDFDIIKGALITVAALIGYVCIRALILAFKATPNPRKSRKK